MMPGRLAGYEDVMYQPLLAHRLIMIQAHILIRPQVRTAFNNASAEKPVKK